MDEYELLCGNAFLTLRGNITFFCTLCEQKFFGFQDFSDHVTTEHYAIKDEEDTKGSIDSFENEFQSEFCPDSPVQEHISELESSQDSCTVIKNELEFVEVDDLIKKQKESTVSRNKEKSIAFSPCYKLQNNDESISNIDETSSSKKYKCTECPYSTKVKLQLFDHTRRHFGDRPYECTECSQRFYRTGELKKHFRKYHSGEETEISGSNEPERKRVTDIPRMTTNDDGMYQCTMCSYVSKEKTAMFSHVRRHSSWKPHQCQECSKSFLTRTELESHVRTHTGEKPFLCTECGCTFSTSGKLSMHKKKHANIRDKECHVCGMKFYNSNLLKSHLTVHSQARPEKCCYCDATFKQRKALRNHIKIHENKLEYECQFCPARFNQRPGLISHMKSRHSVVRKTKDELLQQT